MMHTAIGLGTVVQHKTVPRIIHYCWFGGDELTSTAQRSIDSWYQYAPGYEISRCDESKIDLSICPWAEAAYSAKRYAFVADWARFKLIYDIGGIYMDLGSELVRDISGLVETLSPLSAIEQVTKTVNTGLCIVAPPKDALIARVLTWYENAEFIDDLDYMRGHTVNEIFTRELEKQGYTRVDCLQKVGDWTILPSVAFNPKYGLGGFHIKKGTYSVHRYSASWQDAAWKTRQVVIAKTAPYIGRKPAQIIGRILGALAQAHDRRQASRIDSDSAKQGGQR